MYSFNLGIRFQNIAERYAKNPAILLSKENVICYEELNTIANRMARLLIDHHVSTGDVVCISGTKTLSTFAGIIACLKTGAVYSVLDPDSPIERLRKILSTCRPKLVLAERDLLQKLANILAGLGIGSLEKYLDWNPVFVENYDGSNLSMTRSITGSNPSYIMYTSGSTGLPKGAVMTHANVLNLIDWSKETFSITPEDVLTNVNPLYFDNSVFDLYSSVFNGAALVPFSKEEVRDPRLLVTKVHACGCTLWFSVPSLLIFLQTMRAMDGNNLRSIRRFIFGGEGYPLAKLKKLFDSYGNSSEFFNVYGPTECTCICSAYKITEPDFRDVQGFPPLGYIADNFNFLILDDQGESVSLGELGELCLLGPNVGKGYYNDPDRSVASFVQNPNNNKFREITYKTGDIVRVDRSDGKLYIHGRKDNQIKHMGYRIELEEIEAALHCLDYVYEAAAFHSCVNGLSRIIAIITLREAYEDDQIRTDLKRIIPDYMIPSDFYYEKMLPKNPNGKVDRRSLAEKYLKSHL
ncbi:MAG: amino acid adenylation domain-containing protein [Deltaproteobacteria bacterium]|nr:amino acid adenylation domain-containing protein [Deltaproteobacteria bacterium]